MKMDTKCKRAKWTADQLVAALAAFRNGMPVAAVAREYNIPRRTLRNHILSGSSEKKLGRRALLTDQEESLLCNRIFRLGEVGVPLNAQLLRRSVYSFCELNSINHPFNKNSQMAGKKWLKLFLQRHPDISKRKAQAMNAGRAAKLNKVIVGDYFVKLREILEAHNLVGHPEKIYNIDEKGCRLTLHKQQQVYGRKGNKRVHLVAPEHAQNVTIVACGNAIGQAIPPMILFKGKRCKPEWEENMPAGTVIEMTDKGSMTCEVFAKWVTHLSKFKAPGKILLIFDGAKSHLDANIVDVAEQNDIILFCLPSNCTHELQPLDKSVFGPFEDYWDKELLNFWTTQGDRTLNRVSFGLIFSKVWVKSMTPANLIAGFRGTGIYPYDCNILPEAAFAPSELTYTEPDATVASEDKVDNVSASIVSSSNEPSDRGVLNTFPNNDGRLTFHDILATPKLKKSTTPRCQAINSRAQRIVKSLFQTKRQTVPGKCPKKITEPRKEIKRAASRTPRYKNRTAPQAGSSGITKHHHVKEDCAGGRPAQSSPPGVQAGSMGKLPDSLDLALSSRYRHDQAIFPEKTDVYLQPVTTSVWKPVRTSPQPKFVRLQDSIVRGGEARRGSPHSVKLALPETHLPATAAGYSRQTGGAFYVL
ncbi:uncharacterized protein LOC134546350 [Bacillus rossius redtenbacheri]|uniref:uncharacterized protein LOC134546350 n=1 Tax=Bacillus rossius redtenbacheri TaxID=93214 RepID=UPI002FDE4FF8